MKENITKHIEDFFPLAAIHTAQVARFGAEKYAERGTVEDGFRIKPQEYIQHAQDHIAEYAGGNHQDKETGMHNLAHAACRILALLEQELKDEQG